MEQLGDQSCLALKGEQGGQGAGEGTRQGSTLCCFVFKSQQLDVCLNADEKVSRCNALKKTHFFSKWGEKNITIK